MKGGRIFFYLFAIVLLLLIGVFFVWQRFIAPNASTGAKAQVTPTPAVDVVRVVLVTQRVARGQVLDASVLNLVPISRNLFIEGMFTKVEDAVGKRAKFDLDAGIPLTAGMISESGLSATGSDWALSVPQGMVAISIPINRLSSMSFAPQRGDHVNVIVTMLMIELDSEFQTKLPDISAGVLAPGGSLLVGPVNPLTGNGTLTSADTLHTLGAQIVSGSSVSPMGRAQTDSNMNQLFYVVPSEGQRPRLVSQNLIQNVVVLQTGDFNVVAAGSTDLTAAGAPTPAAAPTQAPVGKATPIPVAAVKPDIITLIVSPQDAITLNYLMFSGAKLTLVGRGANDDTRVQTEAVTLRYLMDQYNIAMPIKDTVGVDPRLDKLEFPSLINDQPTPTPKP